MRHYNIPIFIPELACPHQCVFCNQQKISGKEGQPLTDAFNVLRTLVETHVADEEEVMLPALAEKATAAQLDGLAARILQVKQRVG